MTQLNVEGVVYKVYAKDFRGRTNYTIKLDDDPIWYRCNTNRYAGVAEPGNRIAFTAEVNPDGASARVTSEPRIVTPAPAQAASPAAGGGGDRQASIAYQAARKAAQEFLRLALEQEAITLPAAKAKKLGALEAALDRYTAQFFEDTATLGAVVREAEAVGSEASSEAADDSDE